MGLLDKSSMETSMGAHIRPARLFPKFLLGFRLCSLAGGLYYKPSREFQPVSCRMNVKIFGLACCVLIAAVTMSVWSGEPATSTSSYVSLDGGDWRVAGDPANAGQNQAWFQKPADGAKPARVPGILQESLPGYHGVAWYWREFVIPPAPRSQDRCLIRFHAVDYLARVWLNDIDVGGHEGGETPFTLDVTSSIKPGQTNRLAVRVLNPKAEPIDGIVLDQTPHRNKVPSGIGVGGSYNSGGITESVEVFWVPALRITDVFARPNWTNGEVRVQVTFSNATPSAVAGRLHWTIAPATSGEAMARLNLERPIPPGVSVVDCLLTVPQPHLWGPEDPYLYHLTTRAAYDGHPEGDERLTRFGFRELRVEKGYFRLNGKRLFLKSAHTGNHCPVGAILPPAEALDLLRKDLVYMKACGFNTVRFIAGMAHPYQLDLCDELGLMVYEENLASWLLADSPKMAERFDANLREMILRDRNHPSIVIFGLVNEMGNGPMSQHAQASLGLLRSLDDTRLVLQQSGRWDGQYNVGSVCNPGQTQWQHMWGVENPNYAGTAKGGPWGGYFEGAGDAHVYPSTPHTPAIEAGIRNLGRDSKPVFLSEYGIGSLMNAIRELRHYEQIGANPDWDDFKYFKQTEEKLAADWRRLGMNGVYAFPEDMLRESQRLHVRQRELGLSLIRSNPKICGYNLTGMLDHGYTGEGLWTFWREFKPGIVDALQEGFAPLRWCLFASPMHAYAGRPVKLEAILANEDVLKPGRYPVCLRVMGPQGVAWEKKLEAVVPQPASGEEGPLAFPVFSEDVTLAGPAGRYTLVATFEHGGAPAAGRLTFHLSEPEATQAATPAIPVAGLGIDARVQAWLAARGVTVTPWKPAGNDARQVLLVGAPTLTDEDRAHLLQQIAQGCAAVFLDPGVFRKDNDPVGWLPLKNKGRLTQFSDWLYHKECVAARHSLFAHMPAPGIMDWDYYGPLITSVFYEGQDTPQEVAAAAFAICHSSRPDGYASGLMLGAYPLGHGKFYLNTFNVLDQVDRHPAAGRLLLNIVSCAQAAAQGPALPLPTDFAATLRELGYPSKP